MALQPHEIVWTLTNAVVASRCMHVAAELGVANHIGDEPVSVKQLASACRADAGALDRVLRLLAAHGVFETCNGGYAHTDASRLLRDDHPMSMRAFPRMMGLPVFSATFGHLEHSVRTATPAMQVVEPEGLWPYLESHPAEARVFGQAMAAKAAADIAAVLSAYDFSRFSTVVDVGGGRGHLLRAVLDAVPAAQGILFELPGVIEALDVDLDRLTPKAGDFFNDPLPAADAYLLMEVIHDWDDGDVTKILRAIRRSASPGATILIIEGVLDEDRPDPRGRTLDVIMLAVTGGRERSPRELRGLLEGTGLRLSRVTGTAGPMRIVEAVA